MVVLFYQFSFFDVSVDFATLAVHRSQVGVSFRPNVAEGWQPESQTLLRIDGMKGCEGCEAMKEELLAKLKCSNQKQI